MTQTKTIRVLFVCLGNICRSPMAEAIFRQMVADSGLEDQIDVESAGTGTWHAGERPHPGTQDVLRKHGIAVGGKRARQLSRSDLADFDYFIAMDAENVSDIETMFGKRVPRLLEFAPDGGPLDVPDPFFSGNFGTVYSLVSAGCQGLLDHIRQKESL